MPGQKQAKQAADTLAQMLQALQALVPVVKGLDARIAALEGGSTPTVQAAPQAAAPKGAAPLKRLPNDTGIRPGTFGRIYKFAEQGRDVLSMYIEHGSAWAGAVLRGEPAPAESKGLVVGSKAHTFATSLLAGMERKASKPASKASKHVSSAELATPASKRARIPLATEDLAAWRAYFPKLGRAAVNSRRYRARLAAGLIG